MGIMAAIANTGGTFGIDTVEHLASATPWLILPPERLVSGQKRLFNNKTTINKTDSDSTSMKISNWISLSLFSLILTAGSALALPDFASTNFMADANYDEIYNSLVVKCDARFPESTERLKGLISTWREKNRAAIAAYHVANQKYLDQFSKELADKDAQFSYGRINDPEYRKQQYAQSILDKIALLSGNELREACNGEIGSKRYISWALFFDYDGYRKYMHSIQAARKLTDAVKKCFSDADASPASRVIHAETSFSLIDGSMGRSELKKSTMKFPDSLRQPMSDVISMLGVCIKSANEKAKVDVPVEWREVLDGGIEDLLSIENKLVAQEVTIGEASTATDNWQAKQLANSMKIMSLQADKMSRMYSGASGVLNTAR